MFTVKLNVIITIILIQHKTNSMKAIIFIIIFLASFFGFTQNSTNKERTIWLDNWELANVFTIQTGVMIPIDNLSNYIAPSPQLGFSFGFPIDSSHRIDLGTSIYFAQDIQTIQYFKEDEVLEGGASTSGVLTISLSKVKRIGKKLYWDRTLGTGLGFFQTDIETGKPEEENDSLYGSETLFISIGTALRTEIFKSNIGLELDYFLVPYNLIKKRLPRDFGMQYVTLGLSYGF